MSGVPKISEASQPQAQSITLSSLRRPTPENSMEALGDKIVQDLAHAKTVREQLSILNSDASKRYDAFVKSLIEKFDADS